MRRPSLTWAVVLIEARARLYHTFFLHLCRATLLVSVIPIDCLKLFLDHLLVVFVQLRVMRFTVNVNSVIEMHTLSLLSAVLKRYELPLLAHLPHLSFVIVPLALLLVVTAKLYIEHWHWNMLFLFDGFW